MVLTTYMAVREQILGVIKSPTGGSDLDLSYLPNSVTCEVAASIRGLGDNEPEEDALRTILEAWGLAWTLTDFVTATEGDPTAEVKLSDGTTLTVKADSAGKAILKPILPTFEGMRGVPLPVLRLVFRAIQDHKRIEE